MKALETTWCGVRFRSRLEARWAVFFDALHIKWEYEPQGYQLSDGSFYLPDFFLPKFHWPLGIYAEVKPFEGAFGKDELFAQGGKGILLLDGSPCLRDYLLASPDHAEGHVFREPVCFVREYLPGGRAKEEYRLFTFPDPETPDCEEAVSVALSERFGGRR